MRPKSAVTLFAVVALCAFTIGLYGQVVGGTLLGTVTDPSGAVVPNAQITISNVDTGVSSSDVTNASGIYNVPNLKPGTYKIAVSSAGFRPAVRNEITLTVGSQRVVNIALSVGGMTQEVEVRPLRKPCSWRIRRSAML